MTHTALRLLALIVVLTLAACGPASGGTGSSGAAAPTSVPRPATNTPRPPTPSPSAPAATPRPATPSPRSTSAGAAPTRATVDPGLARAIVSAQADLARRLGPGALPANVVSAEAVEWSDGSLGCPQPGMMYPQVITPGYKVVLETGGQQYAYHGDGSSNMRLCETGSGAPTAMAPNQGAGGGGAAPATGPLAKEIAAAKADLMGRRSTLKAEEISVVSAESVEWNDGSLGCPQPGMMYTMALVPGYQIVLAAGGQTYDYHGANGRPPSLCERAGGGPLPRGRGILPGTPPADPTK